MYRVWKSEKSVFKVLVFLCFGLAIKHSSLPTLVLFPLLLSPDMAYGGLWLDCQGLLVLNWEQSPCRNCLPVVEAPGCPQASQPPHYNSVVKWCVISQTETTDVKPDSEHIEVLKKYFGHAKFRPWVNNNLKSHCVLRV